MSDNGRYETGVSAEDEEALADAFAQDVADKMGAFNADMEKYFSLLLSEDCRNYNHMHKADTNLSHSRTFENAADAHKRTDGESLSPKLKAALKDIFGRFDSDKDGNWEEKDLKEYFKATNGEEMDDEEKDEIVGTFFEDGKMPLESFLDMYTLQTCSRPEDTIADLMKHGYKDDLSKA